MRSHMATFTINSENNIAAHAGSPANADKLGVFASEKELGKHRIIRRYGLKRFGPCWFESMLGQ